MPNTENAKMTEPQKIQTIEVFGSSGVIYESDRIETPNGVIHTIKPNVGFVTAEGE
jgi:hypothetical protein